MSLFGPKPARQKPQYTGLAVQTSSSAVAIAIGFGMNRAAPNAIWQDDFASHKHTQNTGKGGGGSGTDSYTYSGSYLLALGWGPAGGIPRVWKDLSVTSDYTSLGFTFIPGNIPQTPWGYLTTNHPDAALGYPGLVLLAAANFDLGSSDALPQFTFEVQWPLYNTAPGGKGDADPALCVNQLLNSTIFGALVAQNAIQLDSLLGVSGDASFQTYCKANGFGFSPLLDSQEQCSGVLDRWTTIFNTALCWTGYSLLFSPYGADSVTGNGVTYTPDNTLEFALTDDNGDFIYSQGEQPVRLVRKRQSELPNMGSFEIRNRSNNYNLEPSPWDDQGLIDQFGPNVASTYTAHEICEPAIGIVCAHMYGNRQAYVPNEFEFTTGPGFVIAVPGSKGTITDPDLGTLVVRVVDMVETENGAFKVVCEEYKGTISSVPPATAEGTSNNPLNTGVDANAVNTPIIFEPPSTLAGSTPQVWIAVSG